MSIYTQSIYTHYTQGWNLIGKQEYKPILLSKSVIRLQGNESSDTQIGVEGASDDANTKADSDAPYPSDSTQDALGDY